MVEDSEIKKVWKIAIQIFFEKKSDLFKRGMENLFSRCIAVFENEDYYVFDE